MSVDTASSGAAPSGPVRVSAQDQKVLTALGDPTTLRLLVALSRGERDVHELVLETGLPQSSVYRKIHELVDSGLALVSRLAFTPEGRKVEVFASRLKEVRILMDQGVLRVEVSVREDLSDRLKQMWDSVRRYGR